MSKKLPKEAIAFAKSMGLDLNGLEVEAQVKNKKLLLLLPYSNSTIPNAHVSIMERNKRGFKLFVIFSFEILKCNDENN